MSSVAVLNGGDYNPERKPIPGGLHDPHMGPADETINCETCYGDFESCQGHYGSLMLCAPVFNAGYFSITGDILKCICKSCGRILLGDDICTNYLKKMKRANIDETQAEGDSEVWGRPWDEFEKIMFVKISLIEECTKITICPHCGSTENGAIEKDPNSLSFIHHGQRLDAFEVLPLFKKMLGKDCELLHVAEKLENLFISRITVPPLAVRPSLPSKEDDLTKQLKKIIKANENLRKISTPNVDVRKFQNAYERLQFEVAQFINSDDQKGQQPLAGLVQRLKGRQGRIPDTLSGKNVNYTGRTVISPCPYLKISEAAIPTPMAGRLTYPERVTPRNIEKLKKCVTNGANVYPGAILVRKLKVSKLWEAMPPSRSLADVLSVGDIVDRHLMDEDIVLLNKQPSLHRMSMMCHRARIRPGRTLRLNASVCNAYNTDFNGDEMNIHVPQTEEARAEAVSLMAVSLDLLSKDFIGCIRKPKEGCSKKDKNSEKEFFSEYSDVKAISNTYYNVQKALSGKKDNVQKSLPILKKRKKTEKEEKSQPVFQVENNLRTPKNGEILVSPTQDFLISSFLITRKDTFYDRKMSELIFSYMGDAIILPTPAIIKPVMLWSGKQLFSIILQPHKNVNLTVKEKTYSTKHDDRDRELKTMCPDDGFVYFRNSVLISGQLGKATLDIGNKDGLFSVLLNDCKAGAYACCMNRLSKLSAGWIGNHGFSIAIHDVKPQNRLINAKVDMIRNGYQNCEASMQNFYEIRQDENDGQVAAQNLETKITDELNDMCGTLGEVCMETTFQERNSLLIMSQFGSNWSPINICQMVAGVGQQLVGGSRAANGFIDRSLPHFPKSERNPDAKGFVANSFYSGLSATEFFFHAMGVRGGPSVNADYSRYVSRKLMKALEDLFSHYDCTVRNASGDIVQFCYGDDGMDPASMEGKNGKPLNFERLFLRSQAICPKNEDAALESSEVCEVVQEKLSELHLSNLVENKAFSEDFNNFSQSLSGITRRQLEIFVDDCVSRYPSKLIEAGTPIGAIGALSIVESVAQIALNATFRFAGEATMNVTCGVARIIEIIWGYRKISTPIITAKLDRDDNENIAKEVKHLMEEKISVQGIETVKRVVIHKDPKLDKYMLLLEGTGLQKVMSLAGVNARETVSNHVFEIYDVLGIEAARNCIIDQIKLTMQNQGMRIDMRHIMPLGLLSSSTTAVMKEMF